MKPVTTNRIAELIEGEWCNFRNIEICGVTEPETAGAADLVYAVDERHARLVENSNCGAAIMPRGNWQLSCPFVMVDKPYYALSLILSEMNHYSPSLTGVSPQAFIHPDAIVHKTATVYPGAFIDSGVVIGAGCTIYANVSIGQKAHIGENCTIYPNVTIREYVKIGNRVIIQPGTVIGGDGFGFVLNGGVHHKIPQIGAVQLHDDVEVGANATIDRGTFRDTIIGQGTKIDNLVQIGHNVTTGKGCLFVSQSGISGSVEIGDYVTFAGQSGSVGHISIGSGSVIYARGVPTQNIAPNSKISGFPGREHKEELRFLAALRKLPELKRAIKKILEQLKIDIQI
jgi:UDP-3-O-[3-hydroxymyristoyl] glucosamine N-acyltransferase